MFSYFIEVSVNEFIREGETNKADGTQIKFIEASPPIERDIATFYYEILTILYCSLYHFTHNRPKLIRKGIIVFWGKISLTTSDHTHFQVIYRQIWILIFLKHTLCKKRFTRM